MERRTLERVTPDLVIAAYAKIKAGFRPKQGGFWVEPEPRRRDKRIGVCPLTALAVAQDKIDTRILKWKLLTAPETTLKAALGYAVEYLVGFTTGFDNLLAFADHKAHIREVDPAHPYHVVGLADGVIVLDALLDAGLGDGAIYRAEWPEKPSRRIGPNTVLSAFREIGPTPGQNVHAAWNSEGQRICCGLTALAFQTALLDWETARALSQNGTISEYLAVALHLEWPYFRGWLCGWTADNPAEYYVTEERGHPLFPVGLTDGRAAWLAVAANFPTEARHAWLD